MGLFNRVTQTRLFTRTPAHKSSEDLKVEAMSKLHKAVTHAEFREVQGLIERITHRFEEDHRIEQREAAAAARANAPEHHQKPHNDHNHKGKNHQGHPNDQKKQFGPRH